MVCNEISFSDHAITQMFKRSISVDSVKFTIENGHVIMSYFNDRPYPSYLVLGYIDSRPIHVVVGKDNNLERCIIITAYEPDENIWKADFKLKKK